MKCLICRTKSNGNLCKKHDLKYIMDKDINGFRLRKRGRGSRYNNSKYHITESRLAKIIEDIFGKSNVIVSYYPMWAKSEKEVLYEYDIYVKSKNLLISYNGEQHYKYTKFFHKTKIEFNNQCIRDKIKKRLAKENGYKLIEFKYSEPIIKDYVSRKIDNEYNL